MNIIIFGVGDLAKQLFDYIEADNRYNVIGFTVNKRYKNKDLFMNKPIISFEEIEKKYSINDVFFITAIGYSNMRFRKKIYYEIKSKGFKFINFIHSTVILNNNISMGDNNIILSNVVIENNVQIGSNNIIYSSTVIGHDSRVKNNNFISIGVKIAGFNNLGNSCFIGIGSIIIDNLNIADETLIGAGSLIIKDTENLSKYIGIPAKIHSKISEEEGICLR